MPSPPRTVVARRSTLSTVPDMPPTEMMSPTRILRSNRMITPLIRFLITFCAPNPTPMASAPPRKANTVSGIRAVFSTSSTTTSNSTELIQRRITRSRWVDRRSRREMRCTSMYDSRFASQKPATSMSNTPMLLPTVTPWSTVTTRPSTRTSSVALNSS